MITTKEGMAMDKKSKRAATLIIFLCWAAYTAAYIGRLNFNAYIEPIRDQIGASKTEMGLVSSFFFFSYGAGQLIHGILSRKYNTRWSVAVALFGSAAVNIGMTLCPGVASMKYVWLLNGFFQSILWSSLIKTLSDRLPDEMLPKAIVVMSTTAALGTFLAYGMSALLSSLGAAYRWVFLIPAVLLAVIGLGWFVFVGKVDSRLQSAQNVYVPQKKTMPRLTPVFVFTGLLLTVAAIANGFLKDGITTWTPSILKENYGMKESLSILVTLLLPMISIFGAWFSTTIHKRQKNTSVINGILYCIETVVLLLVLLLTRHATAGGAKGAVPLVLLFGVSAMMMAAVNNVITSIIPMYMRNTMDSGLLAGVLDTFCYVGSTLSTALLGYIADRGSWNGVFLCLCVFGAAACALCWVSVLVAKRRKENEIVF